MNNASRRSRPATLLTLLPSPSVDVSEAESIQTATKRLSSNGTPDRRFKENRTLTESDISLVTNQDKRSEEPMFILAKHGRNIHVSASSPSGVRRKVTV